jgi:hypothetical protein
MRPSTEDGGGHADRRRKADCLHELYISLPIARPFARRFWTLHVGTAASAYTLTRPSSSAAL